MGDDRAVDRRALDAEATDEAFGRVRHRGSRGEFRLDRRVRSLWLACGVAGRSSTAAGPSTSTISPRTGAGSAARTTPAGPKICCSKCFESSRATKMSASGARRSSVSSVAPMRVGASYQTDAVGRSNASPSTRRRSASRRGTNPSNEKPVSAKPERTAAQTKALGPGSTSTPMPAARAARINSRPGSEMPGMPASVTTATSALARALEYRSGRGLRVLFAIAQRRFRRQVECVQQPPQRARVFGDDEFAIAQRIERA